MLQKSRRLRSRTAVALRSAGCSVLGLYAAQLGLIYATDKAVPLQHSTLWGTLGETAFQFISDSPSPLYTSGFLKQSRA